MNRADFNVIPFPLDIGAYLYAVECEDGTVKVGSTRSPRIRMQALFDFCAKAGYPMRSAYLRLMQSEDQFGTELALVYACAELAAPHLGREWFRGIDYMAVVERIEQIVAAVERMKKPQRSARKGA